MGTITLPRRVAAVTLLLATLHCLPLLTIPVYADAAAADSTTHPSAGSFPADRWVAKPVHTGPGAHAHAKHSRIVYRDADGRDYLFGGDWRGAGGKNSGRNDVWSLDADPYNPDWRLETPYCLTEAGLGGTQPVGLDEAPVAYVPSRDQTWVLGGYRWWQEPDHQKCASKAPPDVMYYEHTVGEWVDTGVPAPYQTDHFGVWSEKRGRFYVWDHSDGNGYMTTFNPETMETKRVQGTNMRAIEPARGWTTSNYFIPDKEMAALDDERGLIYSFYPRASPPELVAYDIKANAVVPISELPEPCKEQACMIVRAPELDVLIYVPTHSLHVWVYDPATGRWHRSCVGAVAGSDRGWFRMLGYDVDDHVLIGYGGAWGDFTNDEVWFCRVTR